MNNGPLPDGYHWGLDPQCTTYTETEEEWFYPPGGPPIVAVKQKPPPMMVVAVADEPLESAYVPVNPAARTTRTWLGPKPRDVR